MYKDSYYKQRIQLADQYLGEITDQLTHNLRNVAGNIYNLEHLAAKTSQLRKQAKIFEVQSHELEKSNRSKLFIYAILFFCVIFFGLYITKESSVEIIKEENTQNAKFWIEEIGSFLNSTFDPLINKIKSLIQQ